jgi:hypothetical protein
MVQELRRGRSFDNDGVLNDRGISLQIATVRRVAQHGMEYLRPPWDLPEENPVRGGAIWKPNEWIEYLGHAHRNATPEIVKAFTDDVASVDAFRILNSGRKDKPLWRRATERALAQDGILPHLDEVSLTAPGVKSILGKTRRFIRMFKDPNPALRVTEADHFEDDAGHAIHMALYLRMHWMDNGRVWLIDEMDKQLKFILKRAGLSLEDLSPHLVRVGSLEEALYESRLPIRGRRASARRHVYTLAPSESQPYQPR